MLPVQDLVFVVRQIPDERFKREGDDLVTQVRVRLPDALAEGKIDIPHIDGRILRVPLKEVRCQTLLCVLPAANSQYF